MALAINTQFDEARVVLRQHAEKLTWNHPRWGYPSTQPPTSTQWYETPWT
jgi:hypothetical protein